MKKNAMHYMRWQRTLHAEPEAGAAAHSCSQACPAWVLRVLSGGRGWVVLHVAEGTLNLIVHVLVVCMFLCVSLCVSVCVSVCVCVCCGSIDTDVQIVRYTWRKGRKTKPNHPVADSLQRFLPDNWSFHQVK